MIGSELREAALRIVDELNAEAARRDEGCSMTLVPFVYGTDGNEQWIKFGDQHVWDGENEPVETDQELRIAIAEELENYFRALGQVAAMNVRAVLGLEPAAEPNKLIIYNTDAHDHRVGILAGKEIFHNDYSTENVIKLAQALGLDYELVSLSRDEWEQRFC